MSSAEDCVIILFSRVPVPGKVKTRLGSILLPEECALLQQAMTLDVAEKLSNLGSPILLSYSDEWQGAPGGERLRDEFVGQVQQACAAAPRFAVAQQRGSDLGARMANAIQEAFDMGASSCLLLGSDLPCIMLNDIQLAQRAFEYADVVLGPSADGGYWMVGMREPFPELFEGKHYGTQLVLTDAVSTCRRHGRSVALARETFDVDEPADYFQLCNQVTMGDFRLGARTIEAVSSLLGVSARSADPDTE